MATEDPILRQISTLRWRGIGPYRGGRSVAVAGHPTKPLTFLFGASASGVWQTEDGGITWRNISDGFFHTGPVGAIAYAESDPNVIYAGTGEACIRGNVSFGDGVYRSTDAGRTWRHLGLSDTRHIARVRVHPADPDLVYVAALGHAFGPNRERGIFRSTDGGGTFTPILQVSEHTGASDLAIDPTNPRILYAGMWQARRQPWRMDSGGAESGLYRSADGGDTWRRLGKENGLPDGILGRIGVAPSRAVPGRVWAMIEAEEGGAFRSDDGGAHFTRVSDARGPRSRPYYYSHMFAHPTEPDTCYVLAAAYWKSTDGGRTFSSVPTPHGDHHDLWIDPRDPDRQIHGADGGAAVTFDGGGTWSSIHNQPTAELYHVTTDRRHPYRVYGAQQDNTTICVQSASHYPSLAKREWYAVGGAESGYIAVREDDPDIVYAGSSGGGEGGRLTRYDHRTKQLRDISVWPEKTAGVAAEAYTHRFQWTSPIAIGIHDPKELYFCGERVFRSTDEGGSWRAISPDLTRADPERMRPSGGPITLDQTGVEVYCTVFAFAESPLEAGVLWAGSDDGLVHVTRDDGKTWTAVTPPDLPQWSRVQTIEPSRHDRGTVYMATTRYRLDDPRPYMWRTRDGGQTWRAIVSGIPEDAYARALREDPEVPGLLYAATERGVYVSFDAGDRWRSLGLNLPVVAVHDLHVHGTDLIAATHGRSFWILDDVTAVRQLAATPEAGEVRLFSPRDTVRSTADSGGFARLPDAPTRAVIAGDQYVVERPDTGDPPVWADAGQNAPGVILQYFLAEEPEGPVTLTVTDASGAEAVRLTTEPSPKGETRKPIGKSAGSHRVVWDMHYPSATAVEGQESQWPKCAPLAPPGVYTVELRAGERTARQTLRLLPPPDVDTPQADYDEQFRLLTRVRDQVAAVHAAMNSVRRVRHQAEECAQRAEGGEHAEGVRRDAKAITDALDAIGERLTQHRVDNFQDEINFPPRLNSRIAHLFRVASSADARPTSQTYDALTALEAEASDALGALAALIAGDVAAFNRKSAELAMPALVP